MTTPIAASTSHKDFSKGLIPCAFDGSGLTIAIVSARWNQEIIHSMKKGCIKILRELNVSDIIELEVPGSYELSFATKSIITNRLHNKQPIDAVIALGCLIKGETKHFEYICQAVSQGLTNVGLQTGIPVIFGVLTVLSEDQAKLRSGLVPNAGHNHGLDYGYAAVEMARLKFDAALDAQSKI